MQRRLLFTMRMTMEERVQLEAVAGAQGVSGAAVLRRLVAEERERLEGSQGAARGIVVVEAPGDRCGGGGALPGGEACPGCRACA